MAERWRSYWRGVVIAAAVSLRQISTLPGAAWHLDAAPYVQMMDFLDRDGFAPAERVGSIVLTETLPPVHQPSQN